MGYQDLVSAPLKPLCTAFLSNCVMRLDDQCITPGDDAHAGDAEIALHSKLPAYWRERRWVEEKFSTRRHTRSLHAPLPPGGLQNSAGVAAFWLGWPFAQTTASCVRFVTPNLRMICRT